jgi:uncharacterized protein
MIRTAPADRATWVVAFVDALRRAGLPVPTGSTVLFAQALTTLTSGQAGRTRGSVSRERVYWAGRAALVRRPEDVAVYDRVFALVLGDGSGTEDLGGAVDVPATLHVDADGDEDPAAGTTDTSGGDVRTLRWSATEVLRHKDLAACSPAELDEAHRLVAGLRARAVERPSRRRVPDGRPGSRGHRRPDVGRSLRRAVRSGGEVLRPVTTRPGTRPRRLVLLVDVSGSMAPYSRALVRFAHAAVVARRPGQVEVFALGTRTTRITRELATHDPDRALRDAAAAVADWDGGTRLGEGLGRFNQRWGAPGAARGAVVVVLSDGWDRGDPAVLGGEMARLRRVAHQVVWVNPLKASPGYAPLVRGMAAALPHVDAFVEGHSVASLEALAQVVSS